MEHSNEQMEVRRCMVKKLTILFLIFLSVSSYGQGNRFAGFGSRNTCPVEALKFIDSSGITNQTEKDAICILVQQLQDSLVWDSLIAIYPFVGGTSSTCKWNLKDPRDRDSSYRLTFFGGVTFNGVGMLGNSVNGYSDTHFNPLSVWYPNYNNTSFGCYLNLNLNETTAPIGEINSLNVGFSIAPRVSNIFHGQLWYPISTVTSTNTDSRGLYVASRISTTTGKIFKNGSLLYTEGTMSSTLNAPFPIYIGCRNNNGTPLLFISNRIGFAFMGFGLSDSKCSTFNNIFQTFKTATGK